MRAVVQHLAWSLFTAVMLPETGSSQNHSAIIFLLLTLSDWELFHPDQILSNPAECLWAGKDSPSHAQPRRPHDVFDADTLAELYHILSYTISNSEKNGCTYRACTHNDWGWMLAISKPAPPPPSASLCPGLVLGTAVLQGLALLSSLTVTCADWPQRRTDSWALGSGVFSLNAGKATSFTHTELSMKWVTQPSPHMSLKNKCPLPVPVF